MPQCPSCEESFPIEDICASCGECMECCGCELDLDDDEEPEDFFEDDEE